MRFQSGFIAIVGRANVGKSTLLNRLTGEKIAIISNKPQTTRNKILSIKTTDSYQMVFVDTPGVHKPKTRLGEYMNGMVSEAMTDVDAVIFVCEAGQEPGDYEASLMEKIKAKNIPAILALNKIDEIEKERLLPQIAYYSEQLPFAAIVPISAAKGQGVAELEAELLKLLPEGPLYYPKEQITDQQERQIASELIREKLLRLLDKEVPHGTAVEIDSFKDTKDLLKIQATIFCEKDSHKAIIIGKGGAMLKRIGSSARSAMEGFYGKKVFLELWVKVQSDWRNKETYLKDFGYKH